MSKDQNTYAKRARETEKKRKAEAKRARRQRKKEQAGQTDSVTVVETADVEE
ncbi:MAG: hypothetical protein JW719_00655 [Pirellulales bacterium]|nr:hypothetical protein [Pirellulales bacterium]